MVFDLRSSISLLDGLAMTISSASKRSNGLILHPHDGYDMPGRQLMFTGGNDEKSIGSRERSQIRRAKPRHRSDASALRIQGRGVVSRSIGFIGERFA